MTVHVSVIVPCYNHGAFLDDAIDSVLAQTYADFEIIVVDDGSTDPDTRTKLDSLDRPKTRVIRAAHEGLARARNRGISQAAGAYVCALDADDRLEPTFLEKTVRVLDADPSIAFVSAWLRNFGEEHWDWTPESCDLPALLCENTVLTAALVRRALVESVGGYDTRMPAQGDEDWDLWLTLVEAGHHGVILEEVLFNYRRRPGSMSGDSWYGASHLPLAKYRFDKHRASYERHLLDVFRFQDGETAGLLRRNDELERMIGAPVDSPLATRPAHPEPLEGPKDELERLRAGMNLLGAELDAMRNSMSWRVTGPLRDVYGRWLRWRGKAGVPRPSISVIVTCRDLGSTLDEAIESLRRQTRPASEIVIVDDASTDEQTMQVLARLSRDGLSIALGEGRGAAAARNLGAKLTSGEYLACLDADDWLDPAYFEKAAAHLDADPGLDFVSCAMRHFGEANFVWKPSPPAFVEAVATGGVPHASTLVRRRLWTGVGGFDEELPSFELLDFWATAFECGFRGIVLDEPLLNYRVRSGSGYRRSIQADTYRARLAHFYAKHRAAVERHGLELLQAKEAFFISQRNYWQKLEALAASHQTGRAAILSYHRIAELVPDTHHLCTPPGAFREQMRHVREHFNPMALEDLVRASVAGRVPDRAVAVTLDDGYLDALTVAAPILAEFGIPATFFVNSDRLEEPHERWWDILERIFLTVPAVPAELTVALNGDQQLLATGTPAERLHALDTLNRAMWPMTADARAALAREVIAWSGIDTCPRATHRVMTAGEIRTLAQQPGVSIGAHTTHHLALTTQPADTKRREVADDKAALERVLGRTVTLFAYPYGDYDEETRRIVESAGLAGAVTTDAGVVSQGVHPLQLPRIEITRGDLGEFQHRLSRVLDQPDVPHRRT